MKLRLNQEEKCILKKTIKNIVNLEKLHQVNNISLSVYSYHGGKSTFKRT